jgi:hypothetical protein
MTLLPLLLFLLVLLLKYNIILTASTAWFKMQIYKNYYNMKDGTICDPRYKTDTLILIRQPTDEN